MKLNVEYGTPTGMYVIVEQIYQKSGMPSIGNTIGPALIQIYRTVLQIYNLSDTYMDGELVDASNMTVWQMIKGSMGIGVATNLNGKSSIKLEYSGFVNVIQPLPEIKAVVPKLLSQTYIFKARSPYIYGQDPLREIKLYKNPKVVFLQTGGGSSPATAIAKYNGKSREVKILNTASQVDMAIRELKLENQWLKF